MGMPKFVVTGQLLTETPPLIGHPSQTSPQNLHNLVANLAQ